MSKLTEYPQLTAPDVSDVLYAVDVSDVTQSSAGSTKKLPVGDLPYLPCRLATAATWSGTNPVLPAYVLGVETDTGRAKLGDGLEAWASRPYWSPSGAGGGASGTTQSSSVTGSLSMTLAATGVLSQPQSHTAQVTPSVTPQAAIAGQANATSTSSSSVVAVSAPVTANAYQNLQLAVTPSAVGNLLILALDLVPVGYAGTSVSGGGVTTWARATAQQFSASGAPTVTADIWTGVITTAGPATITVANAGVSGGGGQYTKMLCQEYTASGNGLTWNVIQASPASPTTSSSPSFSSQTAISLPGSMPAGSYFGVAVGAYGTLTGTSTANITYTTAGQNMAVGTYLNAPAGAALSVADNNTGDSVNVAAVVFQALTYYASLEVLLPASIGQGTVTEPYALSFSGTGGSGTGYQFAVSSGSLPDGLTMSTSGTITGTPTTAGTSTFTVVLADSNGAATVSAPVSVTIAALPAVVFTRTYPANQNYDDQYYSPVNIPEIYMLDAGTNSSASAGMNMWGPLGGEMATFSLYSVTEWDFTCQVSNPGGSVTCFPNSASFPMSVPWYTFDYFISGWDDVMPGTAASPGGITASACYDNWFYNTLVGPTGGAVVEVMAHFDFRNRGGGPYAALVVPFGGYSVDTGTQSVYIPRTYWDIAYGPTTLYFNQVDSAGNYLSTPTGAVDWKAMFGWCVTNGYIEPECNMWGFSLGFEVCNTSGVQKKFRYNNMWWFAGRNP